MFRTARRPIATLALFLVLAPSIAGCMTTQHIPLAGAQGLDRISGMTTRAGRDIPFRQPGAVITNDTLYAVSRGGQLILPTDSVANVWHRKTSVGRTVGLVASLVLLTAAVAGAIAFGNEPLFSSY